METARELAKPSHVQSMLDFFLGLELLTPQWEERLSDPRDGQWEPGHLALAEPEPHGLR